MRSKKSKKTREPAITLLKEDPFCSEKTLRLRAQRLSKDLVPGDLVLLHGPVGAGKTTFTRYLLEKLVGGEFGGSPTFSIVNEYHLDSKTSLYHLDLYRLDTVDLFYKRGIGDYFLNENNILILEWFVNAPKEIFSSRSRVFCVQLEIDPKGPTDLRYFRLSSLSVACFPTQNLEELLRVPL